jgi:hypothetical protein
MLTADGRIDNGRFKGARVHVDGRFDPVSDRKRYQGTLRAVPATDP